MQTLKHQDQNQVTTATDDALKLRGQGTIRVLRGDYSATSKDLTTWSDDEELLRFADEAALTQDTSAIPRLIQMLDGNDDVVAAAADAIGHIGPAAAKAWSRLLLVLISKREAWVRDTAAYALGQIGVTEPIVLDVLTAATDDPEPTVARNARESLRRLCG
jgi:HEAT repeat protein